MEPPDISEKGGLKDGQPQRSDRRLFMQFLAFGDCSDATPVAAHLAGAADAVVVYEDLNDPRGIAILTVSENPDVFIDSVRPRLTTGPLAGLPLKPQFTMLGRTYSLGYEPDLHETPEWKKLSDTGRWMPVIRPKVKSRARRKGPVVAHFKQ